MLNISTLHVKQALETRSCVLRIFKKGTQAVSKQLASTYPSFSKHLASK